MKNLIEAVIKVMNECKGIEKSLDVGTGNSSYKGVSDKDVKIKVGQAMTKNGLAIFVKDIEENVDVRTWEEKTQYGVKLKSQVFTKVKVKYDLCHVSGESKEICGYGHGVDSQDKSAGKAMTYALKYTLLYNFLVATGHIDDTDTTHSDSIEHAGINSWSKGEERKEELKKAIVSECLYTQGIKGDEVKPYRELKLNELDSYSIDVLENILKDEMQNTKAFNAKKWLDGQKQTASWKTLKGVESIGSKARSNGFEMIINEILERYTELKEKAEEVKNV